MGYLGASVDKGTASSGNKIGKVHLKDGTALDADLVVEGVGIRPSTDYLKDSKSIKLNDKDGSIMVDETFAAQGLKDVWAIGDIATYPYHGPGSNGQPVRIEHWNVAQNMGRSVAQTINKPGSKPKTLYPRVLVGDGLAATVLRQHGHERLRRRPHPRHDGRERGQAELGGVLYQRRGGRGRGFYDEGPLYDAERRVDAPGEDAQEERNPEGCGCLSDLHPGCDEDIRCCCII